MFKLRVALLNLLILCGRKSTLPKLVFPQTQVEVNRLVYPSSI